MSERETGEYGEEQNKLVILEKYFNDLYKFLIYQLAKFDAEPKASSEDKEKLKGLLGELIYVKTLLEDGL